MKMESPFALQIRNDEDGKRDVQSKSLSCSPDETLQRGREQDTSMVADIQYSVSSSSPSRRCSIDAGDGFTRKCRAGSKGAPPEFDAVSHFVRGSAEKLKGQDVIKESMRIRGDFEMHPTRWIPWPPSRNTYFCEGGGFHRPLHQQRSMPEEILRLRNREGWDFLHLRKSGKIHLRSVSFPRAREKCTDSCISTTSLGALTTVASLSGSSVFSSFTRRYTDFTANLRSTELRSSSAAERAGGSPELLQKRHPTVFFQPAKSVELPFNKLRSPSLDADVKTSLSPGRSHTSVDGKHSNTLSGISRSIQQSSENRQNEASCEPTSQPDCGSIHKSGSGDSRRFPSSQLSSTASNKTRELFECVDALPYSTSQSLSSFYPPAARTPDSDVTIRLSRSRPRGTGPTEACEDRPFTLTGEATLHVESQLARSPESCKNLGHASASSCSWTSAGRDAVRKTFEQGDGRVRRISGDAHGKGRPDPEQASLTGEFQLETQNKAKVWRCPNAPHLSYVSAPTTHIPELILGDGILVPPAVAEGVLTDAKHSVTVDDNE